MKDPKIEAYGIRRSDSNRDALEGVVNYLHKYYQLNWDIDQVNDFMKEYRLSRDSNPSWRHSRNAQYVQKGFGDFVAYCNIHLKKKNKKF